MTWVQICVNANIPCAPVNSYKDVAAEQHFRDNAYIIDKQHPRWGELTIVGNPTLYSEAPVDSVAEAVARPAPEVGEHSHECLVQIGFDEEQVAALFKEGVVRGKISLSKL